MKTSRNIDWPEVIDAYFRSGLNVSAFYRTEFPGFCPNPNAIPSLKTLHRRAKLARESKKIQVIHLPEAAIQDSDIPLPASPQAIRLSFSDGTVLEFFSQDPEGFALRLMRQTAGGPA